jgi:hypothetical protein
MPPNDDLARRPPPDRPLSTQLQRPARVVTWKPWLYENSSLIGHASISFNGWVVNEIPVFRKAGSLSVGTPSIPKLGPDGRVLLKSDGKKFYDKLIQFEPGDAHERWQRLCLGALADAGVGGVP